VAQRNSKKTNCFHQIKQNEVFLMENLRTGISKPEILNSAAISSICFLMNGIER